MESIDREIGTRVEELRLRGGLSQGQLAERLQGCGLPWSQRTVSRVESGERPIRFAEAFPLARALGVRADALAPALPNDSDAEQLQGWPMRFTAGIARQIRRYREGKGWSLQQLADECTQLGHPTLDTALANMESGQQGSIAAHELVAIAAALKIPPVMLLFPGLAYESVEALPGVAAPAQSAAQWFSGEEPLMMFEDTDIGRVAAFDLDDYEEWISASEPLRLIRRHQQIVHDWERKRRLFDTTGKSEAETEQILSEFSLAIDDLLERLSDVRRRMREVGMTLPPVLDPILYDVSDGDDDG